MDGKKRSDIRPGLEVDVILKKDQRTGRTTRGVVKDLLTKSQTHPHGIKVRLQDGQVGRVARVHGDPSDDETGKPNVLLNRHFGDDESPNDGSYALSEERKSEVQDQRLHQEAEGKRPDTAEAPLRLDDEDYKNNKE